MAQELPVDMAPFMAEPAGRPVPREPLCESGKDTITLANATLRCVFSTADRRLTLRSLYNEFTTGEMLLQPGLPALFVVEANGKRFLGSRDFDLKSTSRGDTGFEARLGNPELGMHIILQASIDTEGLRLSSIFENGGAKALDFKVAFPCINGLKLSDKIEDDYYYFPWGGGVFSSRPTIMRLGYGDSQALWQIMDVFSPAKGGGVYLRGDDDKGFHKTMSLRRFTPGQPEQVADQYMRHTTKAEYLWKTSALEQQEGTSLTIEYFRRSRQPGQSYQPPSAVLATHAGNWKAAMSAYADWAHKVWTWRPYPSKLKDVSNLGIGGWPDAPLFVNGKYRDDFLKANMDAVELCCWWEWTKLGPGGVPFDKLPREQLKEIEPYLIKDPVTGERMYMGSPTDYVKYNDRFGGIEAFRKAIAANKRKDKLVTLYVNPFKLDGFNNETGRKSGRKWNFVDSNGKNAVYMNSLTPCFYLPEVQDWLVSTMKRVLKETGADGIRLDEVGYQYGDCFAPNHKHELGLSEWNKAMAETVRRVREGMDEVNPSSVLMVEHPGYDYLFAAVDGCLSYDLSIMDTWGSPPPESVRILEVNLQRFYFPECKLFEINLHGRDPEHKRKFWNGVASFHYFLPTPFYNIYKDNEDAYASRDCEALVPTLAKRVYANRFTAGGKTFFHLYNSTGKDYSGPVLKTVKPAGHHVFDMLNCKELAAEGSTPTVELSLKNDDVACVAILPALLEAKREGDLLRVSAKVKLDAQELSVCGPDGGSLLFQDLKDGENQIDLSLVPKADAPEPAVVKLLDSDGLLLDVVGIEKHQMEGVRK
ncbi:MAG: hypothetical protein A2V70_18890 [Planctomycetes bacterium RBG_13_63_9]|nr:MAG: hypothetical protein A2V70_18890 [Planctomycetes bacterium RBG_13_63_9]